MRDIFPSKDNKSWCLLRHGVRNTDASQSYLNRTSIVEEGGLPVNCHLTKNDVRKGKRESFEGAEFMVKSQTAPGLWI